MANMVYANPFGAALSGKEAALRDTFSAGDEARKQRGEDTSYDFLKWAQPLQQAAYQNEVGSKLAMTQAALAHATGQGGGFASVAQNYLGVPEGSLNTGTLNAEQLRGIDYGGGLRNTNLAYPGTYGAGGVYQALPQQALSPEMQVIQHYQTIAAMRAAYNNAMGITAPTDNPNADIMTHAFGSLPGYGPPAPAAPPVPKDPYNMGGSLNVTSMNPTGQTAPAPTAQPSQNPKSIWADEQQGASNGN